MKIKINNYVFDPSLRTITFTDYEDANPLSIDDVLMVTNTTDNIIIYLFNDSSKGGIISNSNTLHLTYDVSSMSSSDALQIWIDTGKEYPVTQDQIYDCIATLRNMQYVLANPAFLDKTANQIRAQITGSLTTLTTLTTCTTVTNLTNLGNYSATMCVLDLNNSTWGTVSRSTIA